MIAYRLVTCGGNEYESMVGECLDGHFDLSRYYLDSGTHRILKYLRAPFKFAKLHVTAVNRTHFALVIKTSAAALFNGRTTSRTIVILHHLGSLDNRLNKWIDARILKNLREIDSVVVVSEYWAQFLRESGYRNVHKIYNAFRTDEFKFEDAEIESFKRRQGLIGKPIIYLGNYNPLKGGPQAFQALKGLDVHFVASGNEKTQGVPIKCTYFDRRDYLRLLKASTLVITMSQFAEGWCRTAHEAMLCGTPVLGSGSGGMRELLGAGRQIICDDFRSLRAAVEELLRNADTELQLGQAGYRYASQFTYEKFQRQWLELASRLCQLA